MKNNFMKKVTLFCFLIPALLLTGCRQNKQAKAPVANESSSVAKKPEKRSSKNVFKANIHKHYKGFKLATVPDSFQGTWYRGNPYDKKISKLVINQHLVNGAVVYQQIDPNLKFNRNSAKQNKEYAGDGEIIAFGSNQIKVRGFFDTVDLVYTIGNFKGQSCVYLSYGTNPQAVNGVIFKNKKAALKYRKYDFSKIRL